MPSTSRRRLLSLTIAALGLALAVAPLPWLRRPLLVSVGSELEGVIRRLEPGFEAAAPDLDLRWQIEGAQDMVNRNLDPGPERARVLIPANRQLLETFARSAEQQGEPRPFAAPPTPIASTLLTAVAWPQRAQRLFPDGRWSWSRLRRALEAGQWSALGGPAAWGSFDLRSTDPLRSSSGQLLLALWSRSQGDGEAIRLLRRSVYRPARSTDILLREFISGGPNEGDVAVVYESGAQARAPEAGRRWGESYRLLLPDPTFQVVQAAAVLRGEAMGRVGDGQRFVDFLSGRRGRQLLAEAGFRDPAGRGGSPVAAPLRWLPPPGDAEREELLRRWQRAGD